MSHCPRCAGYMARDWSGDLSCLNCGHSPVVAVPLGIPVKVHVDEPPGDSRVCMGCGRRKKSGHGTLCPACKRYGVVRGDVDAPSIDTLR